MKEQLNILLLGSGGREAALAAKIAASPRTSRLYVAPGNAGTAPYNVEGVSPVDFEGIREFQKANDIDMIVVGPEQPLVEGIADFFAGENVKVIGPSRSAAMLEGSKEFAKEFMFRHAIPTARFMTVTHDTLDEGYGFLDSLKPPYVLKADGLAAGKGVLILDTLEEAEEKLAEMLDGLFGDASCTVVIEEYLQGIECSVFIATDGEDYCLLPEAKDYKRIHDGDRGPNTGGMGAVSPVPFADEAFMDKVRARIIEPTLQGLKAEGIDYSGFIFFGLMNVEGEPMVIEYNVRMGDPETEVVMPRIESDLVEILEGIADRTLGLKKIKIDPRACATVVLASAGYPGSYAKGLPISGLEDVAPETNVYHAGTRLDAEGRVVTSGGRVLAVSSFGDTIRDAALEAMRQGGRIIFEGKQSRSDIGKDLEA